MKVKIMPRIMLTKKSSFLLCVLFGWVLVSGQNGIIKGSVVDALNNEPVPFANVLIQGSTIGAVTDFDGKYIMENVEVGLYNIEASYLGYETKIVYEIQVSKNRPATVNFTLDRSSLELEEVEVKAEAFKKVEETPLSLRTIGVNEIARYPGGNRDISKVIQSLPGVGSTVSFRNDILIRGGSPAENKFYLEDIEIPTINHFSTQGASGGPVGMINVDFIREVDFYTGAFPANRSNALSSVMALKLIDGREDRPGGTVTVGASEVAAAFETPLGSKATLIMAARRSYLQLLFKAFQLPFLPTYNDFQFKTKIRMNQKNELTILGLAALDDFNLNLEANETPDQRYLLGNLPSQDQWNYTFGVRHKLFLERSYWTFVASQSMLGNSADKYLNNDASSEANRILDYDSREMENKLRMEHNGRKKDWKYNFGMGYEYARYTNQTKATLFIPNVGEFKREYESTLSVQKYAWFGQISKSLLNKRLDASFGLRIDGADYNEFMRNPLRQTSPRLSLSFGITEQVNLNFNTGIFYQLPTYTLMGFEDNNAVRVNQERLDYINNKQFVLGVDYSTKKNSKLSVEGFVKLYDKYPFLLTDSISFANEGGDFGVIGTEAANSSGKGRAYGAEFLFQQKLFKDFYGILSYTLFWSEFTDKNGAYVPSAWDSRHIISITGGKKFNKNWELGFRFGAAGGVPFTPYDLEASANIQNWNVTGEGVLDYNRLNSERTSWSHNLDIRVDKKWFFEKWSLNLYLDIQNAYNSTGGAQPYLNIRRTDDNASEPDPNAQPVIENGQYVPYLFPNDAGQVLPSIGIVVKI